MTTNKLTNKVALSFALTALSAYDNDAFNGFDKQDVLAKIDGMIAQLDKKAAQDKPQTENQKQNVGFKAEIAAYLADGKRVTVTEIIQNVPALNGITNQRVSAILRLMRLDGTVDKIAEKGKTLFFAVA